jgi:predicted AAA+ superfamily ATPase
MSPVKPLNPFSPALIVERLRFENPWWSSGVTDVSFNGLKRRLYFNLLLPLLNEKTVNRAIVMMGPRRVGKTVMLHHAVQHLINNGINPKRICFINIENPIYTNIGLEQLFAHARETTGETGPEGWYVFFDEIQYLKNWEIHLKVLVDSYPKTRFIASGSAAAALKMASMESGAGRFTDFMLPPLTFHEYLDLKNLSQLIIPSKLRWNGHTTRFVNTVNLPELNREFVEYINFGGYPEVMFSEAMKANPGRYIRADIIDKVLLRDLPSLYGIQNVQELNALFSTLAYHSGNEVSLESLSNASGVPKYLLQKYLAYLEAAFLIRTVHRVDENARQFQRANFFKIYLTNPSLRAALFTPLSGTDDAMGGMVETTIFSQWMHRSWFTPYYARWQGGEVDMVGLDLSRQKPAWAVEVKWSNRYVHETRELKSLLSFCRTNKLSSALVTTIDKEAQFEVDGVELTFIPASLYAYVVGLNTIEQKQERP